MPKVSTTASHPDLPALEEAIGGWWQEVGAFEKSVETRSKDNAFVFYDGPPFATGMPHYGHLLASTIKDVIPRFQTMRDKRVERVWGWDCHGLPIENMIEQQLDIKGGKKGIEAMGIDKFNQACRAEVLRLDQVWEKIINRLGRWVDFTNNYKTMDTNYMESIWWGFEQLYQKNLVYQGKKVILYCPRCATPLSNFEIAMDNSYEEITDASNTYKYPVVGQDNTYLLAWSTTPWNKLATPALAVNPELNYVKVEQNGDFYYLAQSRLESNFAGDYKVIETLSGQEMAKLTFTPHYDFYPDRSSGEKFGVIIADQFVTADEGTGIVTLAVYGEDDFRVMQENGVQLIEHVDEQGRLKKEVEPWAGLDILEANQKINQDLSDRGLVFSEKPHTHSVATCYRCSTRLYYAPIPAWFIDVKKIKDQLIEQNQNINWYPEYLKEGRFGKGLASAPDWNISRSRYWGTPMPIWVGHDEKGKEVLRVIGSLEQLKTWAKDRVEAEKITDLHREHLDDLEVFVDDEKTIIGKRIPEVFDCWVESGSMPFASIHYPFENFEFFEKNYPAQFVSEYIGQTRAWFYTMHVISVGIFGRPPFENVVTTGNILAEDGSKMSKSKKNFPDPMELINQYGVDSLRLYLMSSPVMKGENISFNEKEVADLRRKVFIIWWNMVSFYLQAAHEKKPDLQKQFKPDHILDRWLLSRLETITAEVTLHFEKYDVVRASRTLIQFVDELSTWYLRLSRERLRADHDQARQIFGKALYRLAQLMAPLAPYFSELVHHTLVGEETSIHHTDWPISVPDLQNSSLEEQMGKVKQIVEEGRSGRRELGLKLRQPLASLTVIGQNDLGPELCALIAAETNVKKIVWQQTSDEQNLQIEYDTTLTPELKAEGEARELIRQIQTLRRQAGLDFNQHAKVSAPDWPSDWQKEIEEKTKTSLTVGETLAIIS